MSKGTMISELIIHQIFSLGRYLFLKAHSFPRATLSENCSLPGTDNVCRQISEHISALNGGYCLYIFTLNGGYCVYYLSNPFRKTRSFENWGISLEYSPVFGHITRLDQSDTSEIISMCICLWTFSVPQSSQFSSSCVLGKLFASRNR